MSNASFALAVLFLTTFAFMAGGGGAVTYCQTGVGFVNDCADATQAANTAAGMATVAALFTIMIVLDAGWE